VCISSVRFEIRQVGNRVLWDFGCVTWFAIQLVILVHSSSKTAIVNRPNSNPVPRMAFSKQTSASVDEVRPYLHGVAKHLVDRIWGPFGPPWGTKLTEMEDLLVAIQEVLTERMLQQALQRQADPAAEQRPPEFQRCPSCQGVTETEDPEPRLLQTRAGEAEWQEPHEFCRRCRRAFFPSVPEPGH
jgi:hypothetical protein